MLDRAATDFIKPLIARLALGAQTLGLSANALTFLGFTFGVIAAGCIWQGLYHFGLGFILISRTFDALDGAVARLSQSTDRGGFLDICLDFLFYAIIPLAFALANPATNALAAAVLLASFLGAGTSFLAFATLAAKRGRTSTDYPNKSFYFLGGLTEATETLLCFSAMCLWPSYFAQLAYGFASLCLITIAMRLYWGWREL